MKGNRLERWYKERASSAVGSPDAKVWAGISASLDAQQAKKRILYSSVLLLLLVSGTALAIYFLTPEPQNVDWAEAKKLQQLPPETQSNSFQNVAYTSQQNDAGLNQQSIVDQGATTASIPYDAFGNEESSLQNSNDVNAEGNVSILTESAGTRIESGIALAQGSATNATIVTSNVPNEQTNASSQTYFASDALSDEFLNKRPIQPLRVTSNGSVMSRTFAMQKEKTNLSPFSIGIGGSICSLWRLNHETYKGFKKTSLISNNLKWSTDVDFIGMYHFSTATALQGEYSFAKSAGQSYYTYDAGRYLNINRSLSYQTVAVMLKSRLKKVDRTLQQRGNLNYLVGPYFSFLKSAQVSMGDMQTNVVQDYKRYDVGVNIGLQYDYALTDQLFVGAGVRTSIGLINTFPGSDKIPSNFNQNRHFSLEGQVNLTYRLQRI